MPHNNAFQCTVSLRAFENQLSDEDKNSLIEYQLKFQSLIHAYRDYHVPADDPEEETALELEDQWEGESSSDEGSKSTDYLGDESLEDDKAEIPGLSDVLGENISLPSLENLERRPGH